MHFQSSGIWTTLAVKFMYRVYILLFLSGVSMFLVGDPSHRPLDERCSHLFMFVCSKRDAATFDPGDVIVMQSEKVTCTELIAVSNIANTQVPCP